MQILIEEHGDLVVATIAGRPGCAIGPDMETAVARLRDLPAPGLSPFATVRKRLAERTSQGVCHGAR